MATLRQTFKDIADAIREKGVSGTFKPIDMASKIGEIQTGGSGGEDYGYLTFTAEEATTLTFKQSRSIAPHKLLKSTDGVNWVKWEKPSTNGISLNAGQSVYLKADEDASCRTSIDSYTYNYFSTTKKLGCSGDIRSLVRLIAPRDYQYWLASMFNNCKSLTQAPSLPNTTLVSHCYYWMFRTCTSLTQAPSLPATTLADSCYESMLEECNSLTSAPELPATTLANGCYKFMFKNCKSLTQAPELPATTLTDSCYQSMLEGTPLIQAPYLPATTLAGNCYHYMFQNCKSLKRIKMNASSGSWGQYMFGGCKSLELVDMTGSIDVPTLSSVNNFANTNNTYKIVVPDSLYDTWITATNWASIASHIMKQSDWNSAHPDDQL